MSIPVHPRIREEKRDAAAEVPMTDGTSIAVAMMIKIKASTVTRAAIAATITRTATTGATIIDTRAAANPPTAITTGPHENATAAAIAIVGATRKSPVITVVIATIKTETGPD